LPLGLKQPTPTALHAGDDLLAVKLMTRLAVAFGRQLAR